MAVISGGNIIPGGPASPPLEKAGALASNDFAAGLVVGRQAVDTTNGKLYICTVTNGTTTSTWVVVGAQT
jgi:hypothetical protein